ncbi:MAG: hypothetical protein ACRD03_13260 [Acidimicrobiales bacterium]
MRIVAAPDPAEGCRPGCRDGYERLLDVLGRLRPAEEVALRERTTERVQR